jgi:uncharacterized membrane protein
MAFSWAHSDDATVTADNSPSHPPRKPAGGGRVRGRLSVRERAADRARDIVGSWTFALAATVLVAVAIVVALRYDRQAGPVAVLGLVLSGLALVGLSLVLMAAGQAYRTAAEVAMHQLDYERRTAAGVAGVHDEVEQLRADVARVTARLETSARSRAGEVAR